MMLKLHTPIIHIVQDCMSTPHLPGYTVAFAPKSPKACWDWRGPTYRDIGEEFKSGCNPIIIRSKDHGIAGDMSLDTYSVQKLQALGQNFADFIALSVADSFAVA
jgi:hypothetical protein